tara:strand:- start:281 stop:2350 length:2070 start_codon:yes stop_codon:yes gene_type:complete
MKNFPFYLIILLVFVALSNELWSEGMFLDGIYYATISKNLSNGIGNFWNLSFSEASGVFYGHPPLAMGLQSIFFSLFGDSIYIERAFSLLTFLITGFFIHLIWKEVMGKQYSLYSWVVLLFWALMPLNGWACSNNILENTMNIFVASSVFFLIRNIRTDNLIHIIISGLCLSLAFLSKGFTGLFPLAFFFLYFLVFRSVTFKAMINKTLLLIFVVLIPFVFLYIFYPPAIDSLLNYVNIQVVSNIQNIQTLHTGPVRGLLNEIKLFSYINTISIYLYISILVLRRFKLINLQKNNFKIFIIFLISFFPISSLTELTYSFSRYDFINLIIHFFLMILILYFFLYLLKNKRLITIRERKDLFGFFSIIILIFVIRVWLGNLIYLFSKHHFISSVLFASAIYISYKIFRKEFLTKENLQLIFLTLPLLFLQYLLYLFRTDIILGYSFLIVAFYIVFINLNRGKLLHSISERRWMLFFILLGFSGVIPMMISSKQGGFYILTALPYLIIAFVILILPILNYIFNSFSIKRRIIYLFMLPIFILYGPFISYSSQITIPYIVSWKLSSLKYQYERAGRDKALIDDIKLILTELPETTTVNIDFEKHHLIHGYLARYGDISLDTDQSNQHKYLISFENGWSYKGDRNAKGRYLEAETIFQKRRRKYKKNYKKIELNTNKLHLYNYKKEKKRNLNSK